MLPPALPDETEEDSDKTKDVTGRFWESLEC